MINPDQIVTAELLAGLTKCPFCGAKPYEIKPESKEFECHSVLHTESRAASCVSSWCQIATLRARVKELEVSHHRYETVRKMNASEFAKLLQRCVFQDLKFDDEVDKLSKKGTK